MFTNWLTNSVPTKPATSSTAVGNANSGSLTETSTATAAVVAKYMSPTVATPGGGPNAASTSSAAAASLLSTPPDVILEVGPSPNSVRFVAHSIVLGMHSGYLRSAIRLDEQQLLGVSVGGGGEQAANVSSSLTGAAADFVLYLGNVTAEQFAPLLTYMYTGYLELTVENIFGVLLATHVLHMPRALEICRNFLARAQSEGYLGSSGINTATSNVKIIRPIPSKAALPTFGFIAPPMTHHLSAAELSYKTALQQQQSLCMPTYQQQALPTTMSTCNATTANVIDDNDSDELEVFIDSNDDAAAASPDIDCNISVASSSLKDVEVGDEKDLIVDVTTAEQQLSKLSKSQLSKSQLLKAQLSNVELTKAEHSKPQRKSQKREKLRQRRSDNRQRHKSPGVAASGLQVAKAPILASELDVVERTVTAVPSVAASAAVATNGERPKFIVDVASCDGPVRFRRILNTAYGHKPLEGAAAASYTASALPPPLERTPQSVSLSFHQQMAKTISQQRQLQHAAEESSENSEQSSGSGGAGNHKSGNKSGGAANNGEIYVCVYCKHSFKSQYCYQKHAKRHLNPLSLEASGGVACNSRSGASNKSKEGDAAAAILRQSSVAATAAAASTSVAYQTSSAAEQLRREVRPLDMNVQYYPCKTCGSKFPSYYFVHKHRKLCHADEEAQEAESRRTGASGGGGNGGGAIASGGGAGTADAVESGATAVITQKKSE